jgi:hypothetical protein
MNEATRLVALWVRDLLNYDESLILIGRRNFEREDFETAYITVDSLGSGTPKSSNLDFDGDAEEQTIGVLYSIPITLNFYGPNAHDRAMKLIALRRSQPSRELQKQLGIAVFSPETVIDAKALTGQQYGERIEVALNIEWLYTETVDLRRIDEANIDTVWTSFFNDQ